MHSDIPDKYLVRRVKEGDHDAFEQLFNKYNKPICQFIYHLVQCPQETQDIAQKTFVKAWQSLSELKEELSFRAWLYTIARNLAKDHLRRVKKYPFISLEESKLDPLDPNQTFEDLVELAIVFEEALKLARERMRPERLECLLLSLNKAEIWEIAKKMGFMESTVTTYLCQARREFLKIFEEAWHERSSKQGSEEEGD